MYPKVISSNQQSLLGLIQQFADTFYLAGGTAIALQVGHRRSLDFDLFSEKELDADVLINTIIAKSYSIDHIFHKSSDELTLAVHSVRLSFVFYPFPIQYPVWFPEIIAMPDLLTLAAMKAYALGRRAKWKDYVDLYVLLQQYVTFQQVIHQAQSIFRGVFNERLLREQMCYFDDIDQTETVDFLLSSPPSEETIKSFLVQTAIS